MRIGFFDGEMSNLVADYGQLLCWCICEYDPGKKQGVGKVHTMTLADYDGKRWDDKRLAQDARDMMQEFDIVVSWNGVKFDVPFLNTRLRLHGLREVRLNHHVDLMYTAKFKLRLSNAKLDTVAKYLKCDVQKTFLDPSHWMKAMGGHRPSYRYIIDHCQKDVKVLAQVWDKSKHLVREIK